MKDKYQKYLPIGSVVLLKDSSKRIMITGFYIKSKEIGDKIFDYIGCLYPEGILDTEKNLLFNHDDINKIFAIGYSDKEEKEFKTKLVNHINSLENK